MPGVIIVFILQHTKQGTYKGDSELDHLSDMTIRAEKFKLSTVKTRYGQFENVGIWRTDCLNPSNQWTWYIFFNVSYLCVKNGVYIFEWMIYILCDDYE